MANTREEWLEAAVEKLRPDFAAVDAPIPEKIRVSVGFPSKSALSAKTRRIGECWFADSSSDKSNHIFVSPVAEGSTRYLDILAHELIHAAVGLECGHKGPFKRVATALNLEGKMTATVAGPKLQERLNALVAEIGEIPHATLNGMTNGRKKEATRLIKVSCATDSYVVRVSRKTLSLGYPICPCCGEPMTEDGGNQDGE